MGVRNPGGVCAQRDILGTLPQKSHLVPPTWCYRTYFQIVKSKKRSEGEGGLSRGWVIFPHGDYFRTSETWLHIDLHLLHREEQKAFVSLFIVLASTHLWQVKSLKSNNPHKAHSIPINQTVCPVRTHFFSKPQQVTEKLPELVKNYELTSAKIMTFPLCSLPILKPIH